MSDSEILANLRETHGWSNVDMGAGGNCLFLSVAPQISAQDVMDLPSHSAEWSQKLGSDLGQRWEAMPVRERAKWLRRIAMLDELELAAELKDLHLRGDVLPADVSFRVVELFKDMAEEFISSGITELAAGVSWSRQGMYERVRELANKTPEQDMVEFVLKHMEEYISITGREGNWAGSSELAALAHALGRPFEAYGNNWVSQQAVELRNGENGRWEVVPYFRAPCPEGRGGDAVCIFQTNGGGHYQMLASGGR